MKDFHTSFGLTGACRFCLAVRDCTLYHFLDGGTLKESGQNAKPPADSDCRLLGIKLIKTVKKSEVLILEKSSTFQ